MERARIGLTQRVEMLPERAERRDALDQRWASMLESAGYLPVAIPNQLLDPIAFVEAVDPALLVLTGGNDLGGLPGAVQPAPERDLLERRLLEHARLRGLPVLGVCRGMQMMVCEAGGALVRVAGHVATPHSISVVEDLGWPMEHGRVVTSFHEWGLTPGGLGDLVPLAVAPDGTVEAVALRGLPYVGIMWHPEREARATPDLNLIGALAERCR